MKQHNFIHYCLCALVFIGKSLVCIILSLLILVALNSVSLVYDFEKPSQFVGPDIFNPYKSLNIACSDTIASSDFSCNAKTWKRATFHNHTKVEGIFNECDHTPAQTYDILKSFGYDIITFSNHNELTPHPYDSLLQVNVYEHGYNLFRYHKLVFGSKSVCPFDHLVPLFTFQKQFQMDILSRQSDIIQLNHPFRTNSTSPRMMRKLTGYQIIELDSGRTTEQEYWDWSLSAGHYSFGMANDDLHYPDRSSRIAIRCNFVQCESGKYSDVLDCLRSGCWYSMRIPDYGNGDWDIKRERNRHLPSITDIGLKDSTVFMRLSQVADSIKVTGQDGTTLALAKTSDSLEYTFIPTDTYARFTAYFPDGEVIWSNPFARFDKSVSTTPYRYAPHPVNIPLTILYNLLLVVIAFGIFKSISLILKQQNQFVKQ